MLQAAIESVLRLAPEFSTAENSAMVKRESLLHDIREELAEHLSILSTELFPDVELKVRSGGRQANYSPTPWVRIYSPAHSPSAMAGSYLVYLFANDGSACFLSLNQGTSEWRSGQMRPINDRDELRARAAEARRQLRDYENTPLMALGEEQIDLAWESPDFVGRESHIRTRNYEDANVVARGYQQGEVPVDATLLQDLSDYLPLLRRLYLLPDVADLASPIPEAASDTIQSKAVKRTRARSRRRLQDPAVRRAVEIYAEDKAVELLEKEWEVVRVGHLHLGYDLECSKGDDVLHVEVKGTQSVGHEVVLTRNEVHHLPAYGGVCPARHALFVVASIVVSQGPAITCSGGTVLYLGDWNPISSALSPTEYAYRVPWD